MRNVDPLERCSEDLRAQRLALSKCALRSQPRRLVGTRKGQQRESHHVLLRQAWHPVAASGVIAGKVKEEFSGVGQTVEGIQAGEG